jgi:hypothetical protein
MKNNIFVSADESFKTAAAYVAIMAAIAVGAIAINFYILYKFII